MNKKVLSAAALLVMSVTNVAHAYESGGADGHGTVNFSGAVTAQTCNTGIVIDKINVSFVELPVTTTADFESTGESKEAAVNFGIVPLNPDDCPAAGATLSLTGQAVTGFSDVLTSKEIADTNVGIQVLFGDTSSLLNKGYVDAGDNFDKLTKAVNLQANYFRTSNEANAGIVSATASYQIGYL